MNIERSSIIQVITNSRIQVSCLSSKLPLRRADRRAAGREVDLGSDLFSGKAKSFVFDAVQDQYGARKDPDLFLRNNPPPLVLDEIQYVPELVGAIKRAIDRDRRPGQFVLTGSQQRGAMRRLAKPLAGRAAILEVHGFALCEMAERPDGGWLHVWPHTAADTRGDKQARVFREFASVEYRPSDRICSGSFPEVQFLPEVGVPGWFLGYNLDIPTAGCSIDGGYA